MCPSGTINAVCSDSMRLGVFTDRLFTTTFEDDIVHLVDDDLTLSTLNDMVEPEKLIIACWKEAGLAVVLLAKALYPCNGTIMPMSKFLTNCTNCGNNWSATLLTGIKKLFIDVYKVIPIDMGFASVNVLYEVLKLLGIDTSK